MGHVYIVLAKVCDTYIWTPELEFSMLLEVTEAVAMYVHEFCT